MQKIPLVFILFLLSIINTINAQTLKEPPKKLSIYIDCSNTWCDLTYIRSEVKGINYLLDNQAADVHILITSLQNGSGGNNFQMIFFGQQFFTGRVDTLSFDTDRNATESEIRESLLYYLKSGLVPFLVRIKETQNLVIEFKGITDSTKNSNPYVAEKDPWDYWIFRVGANGNVNADANYRSSRFSTNILAKRTTENLKYGLVINASKNLSTYSYDAGSGIEKFKVKNHDYSVYHYLVGSINQHWSWTYNVRLNENTFSNFKLQSHIAAGVEYNVFPYKEVNNSLLTISYVLRARNQRYFDTTIYNKLQDRFITHAFNIRLNKNQKWGNLSVGLYGEQFLNNTQFYNLGLDCDASIRISGGLFFNIYAFGGVTRDQVFLPKGNATPQEVLARQRQLASDFNYFSGFGLNYRFGSKLNNFVNERFNINY